MGKGGEIFVNGPYCYMKLYEFAYRRHSGYIFGTNSHRLSQNDLRKMLLIPSQNPAAKSKH